ncbi:hypothetical protein BBK82_43125 [Lentzea guizhouensis]|uniref:Uncharacterized protein n=1 Tax=Lentzea guizhouensis TaxID=1586287 RepID=A0A1B2HVM3_9PSEU|nr:hypothetical protein [Lentzea guizhouensis]ANZ41735.1 hypothetical protein BBK82_43125 [Lentzea guizhouensis]
MHEDELRAIFTALRSQETPPMGSAADVIRRSRAGQSRRRTIAVAGSAVATVGVLVLALVFLPEPPPLDTPPATNSDVRTTPNSGPLTTPLTTTTR